MPITTHKNIQNLRARAKKILVTMGEFAIAIDDDLERELTYKNDDNRYWF